MAHAQLFGPPSALTGPGPSQPVDGGHAFAVPAFPGIPTQASMLVAVDKLKFFLATAPSRFDQSPYDCNDPVAREERCLNRFQLPTGELISCVLWNGLYHVTGTDIVRVLHFRFAAFGRPVRNPKKFEEGIFSDLRNLKSGTDATLEEPKSEFLELLFKYNCIRTQKKQKVFYWFSVPHDRLFLDALDRDLKREKLGVEPTTEAVAEPALSFVYNPAKSLFEQFTEQQAANDADAAMAAQNADAQAAAAEAPRVVEQEKRDTSDPPPGVVVTEPESDAIKGHRKRPSQITTGVGAPDGGASAAVQEADGSQVLLVPPQNGMGAYRSAGGVSGLVSAGLSSADGTEFRQQSPLPSAASSSGGSASAKLARQFSDPQANAIFGAFALFEGSPTYKQRRKPGQKRSSGPTCGAIRTRDSVEPGQNPRASASPMPGQGGFDDDGSRPGSSAEMVQGMVQHHYAGPAANGRYHLGPPAAGMSHSHSAPLAHGFSAAGMSQTLTPHANAGSEYFAEQAVVTPSVDLMGATVITHEDGSGNPAKSYVCPLFSCGRLFKRLEHLKRHLRIHTMEKPYPCTRCDKTFARSDNLAAHLKIHDKVAARSGSATSADRLALEAEEDIDESTLMQSAENSFEEPQRPPTHSPPGIQLQSSGAVGAAPYFGGYQQNSPGGLPTQQPGFAEHSGQQWSHYGYSHIAPQMLTPDPSPDPSAPYAMGAPQRQMSLDPAYGHGHPNSFSPQVDARRFRSATPTGGRAGDTFNPRRASAGPRMTGHDVPEYGTPLSAGVSPLMTSFQQQLNMVNSLNADFSPNAHAGPTIFYGADGLNGEGVGLGLAKPSSFVEVSSSMPPPSRPASSYGSYNEHHGSYTPQQGTVSY